MRHPPSKGAGSPGAPFEDGEPTLAAAAPLRLAPAPAIGAVIRGKYRLERLIGEGGMGAVWRAHHLQLDLPVAIKLLHADANQEVVSARMKIEARAAARLVHPAIVRVFDIDTTESGEPFIVMELLEGESLADLLDRGALPAIKAVQLLLPIAEALVLAHEKGIFHRDLKPANILLAPHGEHLQPKLLDFGIAKLTGSAMPSGSLTETGIAIGSPDYMSPEQARGRSDVDYRADIWQLSVVLYEALTTQPPFQGDNYNALMRAIVEDTAPPLPLDDQLDRRLAELVAWGLEKKREDRPDSVRTWARGLAAWLIGRGVHEDATGAPLAPKWLGPDAARISTDGTSASIASAPPRLLGRRSLWLAIAASCAAATVAWLVARGISPHQPASQLGAAPLATEPHSSLETRSVTSAVIASNPPSPSPVASTESASPPRDLYQTATPELSSKPRVRKTTDGSRKAPPAAPSSRVVHDETRELLQAY